MLTHSIRWALTGRGPTSRLAIAFAMLVLLLLGLAYWWLENLPHEIFGTAMFVILGRHIHMNRRWFMNLFRGRYDLARSISVMLHLMLVASMLLLLGTSVIISKSVVAFLPLPDSVPMRDVHWFSAYWVMILVGIHLGLHWSRVTAMTKSATGFPRPGRLVVISLRMIAVLAAGFGLWSLPVLGIWTKLSFNFSIDFWNFNASVSPFFAHWVGVVALAAVPTHYAMQLLGSRRTPSAGNRTNVASAP